MIAALSLLVWASTSNAEWTWVPWFTSGKTAENTSPVDAFVTKKDCEAEMTRVVDARVKEYKRKYPEDFAYVRCLPDTVDPRGRKEK